MCEFTEQQLDEIEETVCKANAEHVAEAHTHDEDVRAALFGPRIEPFILHGRDESQGVVGRVASNTVILSDLHAKAENGGIRAKLVKADRLWILGALIIFEVINRLVS